MRLAYIAGCLLTVLLSGCAMSEEMKRIHETQQAEKQREAGRSTNLNGEQLFIRSCNTCHPGGKAYFGPSLENLEEHFPDDRKLIAFIRKGKGAMPAQPKEAINDKEMEELVAYLRKIEF